MLTAEVFSQKALAYMFLTGFLIHLPQGFRELYLILEDLMYYLDTLKIFFNCYLAAPRPTLGYCWGGSLTQPMLIACILHIRREGYRNPHSEVGSLGPADSLVGFEPGTFRF